MFDYYAYQKKYREEHREQINKKKKHNYLLNSDKYITCKKKYYEANKEKIKEKYSQPFNCECGITCVMSSKMRHFKSMRHENYIKAKQN